MALKILNKGMQITAQIDPTLLNGVAPTGALESDPAAAELLKLKGGRLVAIKNDGTVQLASGDTMYPIGFLIKDATDGFYENKPTLATGAIGVACGNCLVETDQIDTTQTFNPGDKLYAGKSDKVGLVTNQDPGNGKVIGIAMNKAGAANPNLQILVA